MTNEEIFKELCKEFSAKGTARYAWVTADRMGKVWLRRKYIGESKTVQGVANIMMDVITGKKCNYTMFK